MSNTHALPASGDVVYLASPYTDRNPRIQALRVKQASMVAGQLMAQGIIVYSPITHGHHIEPWMQHARKHDHSFWMEQCLPLLRRCDRLIVLPLTGWQQSRGVRQEIQAWNEQEVRNGPPVFLFPTLPGMVQPFADVEFDCRDLVSDLIGDTMYLTLDAGRRWPSRSRFTHAPAPVNPSQGVPA